MHGTRSQAAKHSTSSYEKTPSAVVSRLSDAEPLAKVRVRFIGTADDAREPTAGLQHELADRLAE